MISRRGFLLGVSSAAVAAALPTAVLPSAPVMIGVDMAAGPDLVAFAVGTPGEYDWISVFARSAEEAWTEWCDQHWYEPDERRFDPDFVMRVEGWDHLSTITSADWLRVGLGHVCDRCGYETHPDIGARVVVGDVVCEECLTLADRASIDPDDVVEDLANRIADEGAGSVRDDLEVRGAWPAVAHLWSRALEAAAA